MSPLKRPRHCPPVSDQQCSTFMGDATVVLDLAKSVTRRLNLYTNSLICMKA